MFLFRYKPNGGQFNGDYIALTSNQKLLEDLEDDSEDEIVYCSDENPVLPTNDPIPVKSQPDLFKVLLCPWRYPDALEVTAQAANILCIISSMTSFVLAVVLIHFNFNLVVTLVLFSVILLSTILTAFLPSAQEKLSFQVPLVPFLPNLSIFINLYLMLKLSAATWCRFLIWMTLGFLIYVFYGCKHSTEEKRNRF